MKNMIYKAIINGDYEYSVEATDLEQIDVIEKEGQVFHILISEKGHLIRLIQADYHNRRFTYEVDGHPLTVKLKTPVEVQVDKMGYATSQTLTDSEIKAPMPGLVLDVRVKKGDSVHRGDPLIILEAMKMENIILAAHDAVVEKINVEKGQAVEKAEVLLELSNQ